MYAASTHSLALSCSLSHVQYQHMPLNLAAYQGHCAHIYTHNLSLSLCHTHKHTYTHTHLIRASMSWIACYVYHE